MRLHIHILTRGRPKLLERCLNTVLAAIGEREKVIVHVNGTCAESEKVLKGLSHVQLHWEVYPKLPRAEARNRMFQDVDADIIHCLDDDVEVPAHLFREVREEFLSDPELAILGGPNLTPPQSPWQEKLFGATMASPFAAPMVRKRYSHYAQTAGRASEHSLILCNLAFRKKMLPSKLQFDGQMRSNEENLFLYRCRSLGLKALWKPRLYVYHHRRASWKSFAQQVYTYGFGRAQQTWRAPSSLHPAFLAPSVFCLALFFLKDPRLLMLYIAGAAAGALCTREIRELGILSVVASIPVTLLIHCAYGAGFIGGFLAPLFSFHARPRPAEIPA